MTDHYTARRAVVRNAAVWLADRRRAEADAVLTRHAARTGEQFDRLRDDAVALAPILRQRFERRARWTRWAVASLALAAVATWALS